MRALMDELRRRWTAIFAALAGGDDVPPALRLRTEGLMEAALLVGPTTAGELDRAMDECYRGAFGHPTDVDFGPGWRDFYPFPQIPAAGRRAPVYPSTSST